MKRINSYEEKYEYIRIFCQMLSNLKEYAFKKSLIKIFIKNEMYHKYSIKIY